jgi:hypothetical protein
MCPQYASQLISFDNLLGSFRTKVDGTVPVIVESVILNQLAVFIVHRIGPHQIAEEAGLRDLSKTVYLSVYIVDILKIRPYSSMHSEIFLSN